MRLSDDLFSQICAALDVQAGGGLAGAGPADNQGEETAARRRERRWQVDVEVPCASGSPAKPAPSEHLRLIDISPAGASALSRRQWAPGDRVVLYLPLGPSEALPLTCEVRSSRIKLDGTFRVGLQFEDAPDASAERALGEMFQTSQSPTQGRSARRSERNEAQGRATIYTYDEFGGAGPIEQVPARDYSAHGVCIIRNEPFDVGQRFMVRLPVLDDKPITRLCRVTNVVRDGPRYRVGAEFIPFPGALARAVGFARGVKHWVMGN